MKNIKKLFKVSLPLLMFAVLLSVTPWHPAEAYGGNTMWEQNQNQIRNLNQVRIQNMTLEHRQEMLRLLTHLHKYLQQMLQLRRQGYVDSEVQVITRAAIDIEMHEAILRGEVIDFNRSDYADVWFEYDTDRSDLDQSTDVERIMSDEDSDFEQKVTGLKKDTTYYFRAVGKDDEDDIDYGTVFNFYTTGVEQDEPDITTQSAIDITDNSAVLRGFVDMNDFRNGHVFFVYGEDEDQVDEVSDNFDTYEVVDEDGDNLQKVLVERDLDDNDLYEEEMITLDENTEYYFNLCVAYESAANDEVISCGNTRSFTTD